MLSSFLMPGVGNYNAQEVHDLGLLSDTVGVGLTPGAAVSIFDTRSGELLAELIDAQVVGEVIAASADGATFAVAGHDGVGLWSATGRQLLGRSVPNRGHERATLNSDGTRLVAFSIANRAAGWNLETDPPTPTEFAIPGPAYYLDRGRVLVRNDFSVAFATTHGLHDPLTFDDLGAAFSEGPKLVVTAARVAGGFLYSDAFALGAGIYDMETGELVHTFEGVVNGDFSSDGTRFAAAIQGGGALATFDTQSWQMVGEPIPADGAPIWYVEYSPDDLYLMTSDPTGEVTLRDPETLAPTGAPLIGHRSPLGPGFGGVSFSPDNRRLVTSAEDELALWDIETRQQIGDHWPGGSGGASGDLSQALTLLGDHIVIWDLDTDRWFEVACHAAGRNLTRDEWERFGPSDADYQATCPQWPIEG